MPLPKAKSNSFFNNFFFIFIIRFFPSLANLMVMIWYSRYLPQDTYGNYQHFWIHLNVIVPIACLGIHALLGTYSRATLLKLLNTVAPRYHVCYGIWITLLAALFAWLQWQALGIVFIIPFLFLICFALSVILESFLVVCRNYTSLTIVSVAYSAAFWLIHFYVLKQEFSLQALFTYLLIIIALKLCIYTGIVVTDMKQKNEIAEESIDIAKTKQLWAHLGVYDISQSLFNYIDKFIISIVLIAPLSAIYYNGSMNIPFLPLLLSAAGSAILILVAGNKDGETDLVWLMNRSGRVLSCVVFPVFFYLFFFRYEFIITIFKEKYIPAIPIFTAAIFVLPVKAYSFTTVLQKMHKGSIINIGAIADLLLACALIYPMYQWLGLPGVALSFVITTYLQASFYLFHSAKLLNTSPFKLLPYMNWLIKLIVFFIVFIAIHYVCNLYFTQKISLILGGVIMIAIVMSSLWIELKKQSKDVGIQS